MSKRLRKNIEKGNADYERAALAEGKRFRVSWSIDSGHPSFVMVATFGEAQLKRDEVVGNLHIEIPRDYYGRQARLVLYTVAIDEHVDGTWRTHGAEARDGAHRVDYLD